MSEAEDVKLLVLVRDLMSSGRIMAEAQAAGVTYKVIRDPAQMGQFAQSPARLLIVDLGLPGGTEAAAAWRKASEDQSRRVIGVAAHVDKPAMQQARQAGLDQVLTRGQFVNVLSEILRNVST